MTLVLEEALPLIPRLRRHARLLCGDAARADDLLQDTLERAARKGALFHADGPGRPDALRGWLLTLMHRLYLNQRRDAREALHDSLDEDDTPLPLAPEPQQQVALRLDLERALAALPAASREILLLICVEELSYQDAAGVLDVPLGTVMSRLSRARDRLRTLMTDGAPARAPLRVVK
ncbi:RNA polymerase subunit sigma-24 [Roseateles aquatilis]|uniref:RNA polymerase subunit sigma-24 n=1 Tax=Roseateles aquatilis TaxID=431061 RepID=A0A246JM71_9BURK|nr:sigma-70 family RNA polymerase sigma factor [Roseateles aquatilis]OWQ93736.1 RNA polymerase subunit sigma-24 [Roseateles aquatilis]